MPLPSPMPEQKSTSRYILTVLAMVMVITAFILVALNAMQIDKRWNMMGIGGSSSNQDLTQAYKKGFEAARAMYSPFLPPSEENPTQFNGVIQEVGKDQFVVVEESLFTDPVYDGIADERVITIDASTSITKQVVEDPMTPPTIKTLTFSDLKVGSRVRISSSEPVKFSETIHATSISLLN